MMKMEQKIATGGVNNTSTPILKFRMKKALLDPASEARHIEHCDKPVPSSNTISSSAAPNNAANLVMCVNFISALPQSAPEASL